MLHDCFHPKSQYKKNGNFSVLARNAAFIRTGKSLFIFCSWEERANIHSTISCDHSKRAMTPCLLLRHPPRCVSFSFLFFPPTGCPVFLTRHGEAIMNQMGSMGGDTNLSEEGNRYASVLADFIAAQADAGQRRLSVWCSPMKRAVQTARAVRLRSHSLNPYGSTHSGSLPQESPYTFSRVCKASIMD